MPWQACPNKGSAWETKTEGTEKALRGQNQLDEEKIECVIVIIPITGCTQHSQLKNGRVYFDSQFQEMQFRVSGFQVRNIIAKGHGVGKDHVWFTSSGKQSRETKLSERRGPRTRYGTQDYTFMTHPEVCFSPAAAKPTKWTFHISHYIVLWAQLRGCGSTWDAAHWNWKIRDLMDGIEWVA